MTTNYPPETLGEDYDDGTIATNVDTVRDLVVGHRIVKAETTRVKSAEFKAADNTYGNAYSGFVLTLDNGHRVLLEDTNDCCAFTELEAFLLHPECVDHIITGVGTTDGYQKWHIFADMGDVLELTVGWSAGNPFYYAYGFDIFVSNVIDADPVQAEITGGAV